MGTRDDVLVVGGGVVGLACGLALAERGKQVRVVDAGRIAGGSSHGNCGTLTPSHALPLAAPGAVGKALRWMLVPDAPLYMKPRIDPVLWSWLLRFAGRCNANMMMRSAAARIALLQASREAFPEWIASHGIDCHFAETGTDHVFRTERELQDYLPGLEALAGIGVASEVIDGADYERQEPAVLPGVVATVRFPGDASLRPDRYAAGLARALQQAGGSLVEYSEVRGIDESGDGVRVSTTTGEFLAGDVVLAVGAWSPKLARSLKLPRLASLMQPGKGYSITYDRPALAPKRPLTLQERSVCVSVWESGYRLGSTMEFSGFDTTLNRRRLDALERAAREYLHEAVGPVKREEWYGWRPMMVDDVPVIGAVPGRRRQWLATGHGMLGVSMSVATSRLLADLVTGETPALDPAPYRLERFGR
ncbi:NAD(P)/FAD-dependent oxidoreductase [Cognatiluteimonas lumbrici]|uniref:NAD(P)/FAD-dependent oxidoreductase n=1 Tax=Cognatiluteimonas lumbrici TaxID=2559601 RepID=UPI001126A432|nr:FAD-dependent oxidoreductase [Luteimonas lumbrici]